MGGAAVGWVMNARDCHMWNIGNSADLFSRIIFFKVPKSSIIIPEFVTDVSFYGDII